LFCLRVQAKPNQITFTFGDGNLLSLEQTMRVELKKYNRNGAVFIVIQVTLQQRMSISQWATFCEKQIQCEITEANRREH